MLDAVVFDEPAHRPQVEGVIEVALALFEFRAKARDEVIKRREVVARQPVAKPVGEDADAIFDLEVVHARGDPGGVLLRVEVELRGELPGRIRPEVVLHLHGAKASAEGR